MVLKITNLHILRYLPTCWLYLLECYTIDNQRCTHAASTTMDKTAAEVLGQAMNRKPSNGKSVWCTMVLRLMDTEEYSNNYCRSLALVLELFPEVNRKELEKELDKYI